jgi:hypothetical protein
MPGSSLGVADKGYLPFASVHEAPGKDGGCVVRLARWHDRRGRPSRDRLSMLAEPLPADPLGTDHAPWRLRSRQGESSISGSSCSRGFLVCPSTTHRRRAKLLAKAPTDWRIGAAVIPFSPAALVGCGAMVVLGGRLRGRAAGADRCGRRSADGSALVVRNRRRIAFVWCLANHQTHDSSGLCHRAPGHHRSDPDP